MIILSAKNLTKAYGTDVILDKVSFSVNEGDRIGIIGVNGAGKTTLFRIITGDLPHEEGDFFLSKDLTVGYLKQDGSFDSEKTVMEAVEYVFRHFPQMEEEMQNLLTKVEENPEESEPLLEKYDKLLERYNYMGGYAYKSEIRGVLAGMDFGEETYEKKISMLSGGEKTRLALAILLLEKPDILFLDEPTNHLDIDTLRWLEQYLKGYKGTILMVSHDRYFLDRTVNRVFEIQNKKLSIYEGNYSFYAAERKVRRESELRRYEKQQKEIKRQEDMVRRFKERGTEKLAKRAASREKMLAAMELVDRPESTNGKMKINFRQDFQSGRDVIFAENLSKSFGYGQNRRQLFRNGELDIKRGERICIVGPNGIGKTTLLRMLLGELQPDEGRIRIGHNVQFGYYDQGQQLLNPANTVIEELQDTYHLYSEGELRNLLGRFLFRGESVFLDVGALSGGEKARLALLKLMMSGANTLILDEPTNHLDIESKEVFEEALLDFPGTCIIVSHDRYFLNRVPTRIAEMTEEGIRNYQGKYDYYLEKKQQLDEAKDQEDTVDLRACGEADAKAFAGEMSSAEERRLKKEKEAEERRIKRKRESLEEEIHLLENEISELEKELTKEEIMTDHVRLAELSEKITNNKECLDKKYEEWLELQE